MSICSGIEGIDDAFLFPADELGASPRWLDATQQLEIEYFNSGPYYFESRGDEMIDPVFHPAPAGRAHILIGEIRGLNSVLVCNFAVSDPGAPPGEIASCFNEPDILGDLTATLTHLLDSADELRNYEATGSSRVDPAQAERSDAYFQIGRLIDGIRVQNRALIRHTLSARWRHEFDRQPGQRGLNMLRRAVLWGGAAKPELESHDYDLWGEPPHSVRATAQAPSHWFPERREAVIGVVKEHTVWRIDSWTWSDPLD